MATMHTTLFQIMAVLRHGSAEAGAVIERLGELAPPSEVPSVPSFYRHLRRGMEEGWIRVEGAADPDQPGRPAQAYGLTPEGEAALHERSRELEVFTRLAFEGPEGGRG